MMISVNVNKRNRSVGVGVYDTIRIFTRTKTRTMGGIEHFGLSGRRSYYHRVKGIYALRQGSAGSGVLLILGYDGVFRVNGIHMEEFAC